MTDRHILGLAKSGALRVIVLTALGAVFAAACGGGGMTDSTGSGGAGSGGTATGSGGTSTGSGGTSTNTGGNSGDGGATSGGASSTGGTDGEGGLGGGDGANDPECPATMPGPEDECEGGFMAPTCTYGDQECQCAGFGMNATWECGEPVPEEECPAEAPGDGDACTTQQFCQFGGDNCVCDGEQWNCF